MTALRSQYKGITDDDEPAWTRELKQLEAEFGYERAERAIVAFIRSVSEFPNIAKLREFIPPLGGRMQADSKCPRCSGTGFERCRHCDCRKQQLTDTGLDEDAHPSCDICAGRGSLVDNDRKRNNRVRSCACRRMVAA
jgi:hypothetical protein